MRTALFNLIFIAASVAFAATNEPANSGSIQDLLNQAEGALLAKPTTEKKSPKKPKTKSATPTESESTTESTSNLGLRPVPTVSNPTENKLTPFDGAGVDKVLALDLEAQKREHDTFYPQSVFFVGLGMQRLEPKYSMVKDDDTFTNSGRSALNGVFLEVSPRWKIEWMSSSSLTSFMAVSLGTGYFQADVAVQRTGVQPEMETVKYQLFPGDAAFQLGFELWNRFGIYGSYGAGFEVLHQSGRGTTDSVTDTFYGEVGSVGLFGNINRSMQIFVTYKARGTRLILKQSTISGQMIMGGLAFALSG